MSPHQRDQHEDGPIEVTNADLWREMRAVRTQVETLNNHIVNPDEPHKGLLMRVMDLERNLVLARTIAIVALTVALPALTAVVWEGIKVKLGIHAPPTGRP